ncbi:hypothetical protein F5Y12DRAFT_779631 [Xylaria sp. FL1777]|nr:hypothetical protein F5Y12DRAFT_779631 [Xylaria sp. FL1777]
MAATDTTAPLVQGFAWVITALSLLAVNLRLYIKWKYRGKLWYDDYILVASVVFLVTNASLVQRTVDLGFGRHIEEIAAEKPQNIRAILMHLQVLSGVVRISTTLARISFATTLLRLADEREKRFVWCAITTLPAVAIPSIIFPFVACIPYDKIFDPSVSGTCIDGGVSIGYFYFEAAYTSFIDFALVVVPWRILSRLQLRRVEKLGASFAMSLGVLSGVVTIVKAAYTTQIRDPDFTYSSTALAIWNMVEPASVIIATSLPNLRVFIVKNSQHLKASFRIGSTSRLGSGGKPRKIDDIYMENVQSTMKAISAGTDRRRGEGTAWITSRERGDDGSEKNILPRAGIVQTSTFAVEYPEETDPAASTHKSRLPSGLC